ncbi:TetR/AcrR family transcriptional regulator [Gordonia asplenii]|nr:TetR/AcrR family transcriptional regulator [Gordonia asplenii]
MTLDAIVETGIDIADREGVAGVTMQKVAAALGATKMAIYRYVPGRDELLAVMLDRAIGGAPDLSTIGWRDGLADFARKMYARSAAHPWIFDVANGVRVYGPNELSWLEAGLGTLATTTLPGPARLDTIVLVTAHVRMLTAQHTQSQATETEIAALMAKILTQQPDSFRHVASVFSDPDRAGRDNAFDFGLSRILDGVAVLVEQSHES